MAEREYYGIRKGLIPQSQELQFDMAKRAMKLIVKRLDNLGYFQKYFGINCTDGYIDGVLGDDIETAIFLKTGIELSWPFYDQIDNLTEMGFFTLVEFLHDHCSHPIKTDHHSWNDCGIHVVDADDELGQKKFRDEINTILKRYKNVELDQNGEILENIEGGFEKLFNAKISTESDPIQIKIEKAILKFRRAKSTIEDRKDAIRELSDILEYMRPRIKTLNMSKDENEIFQIANNFGIRHFNSKQKNEYDKTIWLNWIFYCFLATIHATQRLLEKENL